MKVEITNEVMQRPLGRWYVWINGSFSSSKWLCLAIVCASCNAWQFQREKGA